MKIKKLPDNLIKKIAAGEVVERPASVIKELIENSIDAQATQIDVNLQDGGIKSIEIRDNGTGMSPSDAKQAYQLHTTSKISSLEDLESIYTFGFRGEAIASICSICELEIHTKHKNSDPLRLVIENSQIILEDIQPRKNGTTIKVTDIFRHVPARKKFLKTPNTEYRYCLREFINTALINPQIGFSLTHNTKNIYKLEKTSNIKKRFCEIFTKFNEEDLIDAKYDSPDFKIEGLLLHPSKASKDKNKQFVFLNSRYVNSYLISRAVKDGYFTLIPENLNPAFLLNVKINPKEIDVNIHPRKLEVKINKEQELFRSVRTMVKDTLEKKSQREIKQKFNLDTPEAYTQQKRITLQPTSKGSARPPSVSRPEPNTIQNSLTFSKTLLKNNNKTQSNLDKTIEKNENRVEQKEQFLFKAFQIFDTYIVIEENEKLEIIDQHAAHERITYERILNSINTSQILEKQDLLIPIVLELPVEEMEVIKDKIPLIQQIGMEIDMFGDKMIKINAIPTFASKMNYKNLIDDLLEDFREGEDAKIEKLTHKLTSTMACHSSIRAGKKMSPEEVNKLVLDLRSCTKPYSCPHGRPIIWQLKKYDIEKKFKRS